MGHIYVPIHNVPTAKEDAAWNLIWRTVVPGNGVTLPAKSTLASVFMGKKLPLCPSQQLAFQRQQCSYRLALTSWHGWASQSVIYIEEKLPRLGGWPYHRKRVTHSAKPTFFSHVNGYFIYYNISIIWKSYIQYWIFSTALRKKA